MAPIRSEQQLEEMLSVLTWLEHEVAGRRSHELASLLEIVIDLVAEYEAEQFPIADAKPREVLRFLMEQHSLKQADLQNELGSQGVVSEILRGKREINVRQAKALAKRFGVLPMAFI